MKGKALIGLGASGSMLVEEIVPHVSDMEVYCINSSQVNTACIEKVPEQNRFCFGLESGFAKGFINAWSYLKENFEAGNDLMKVIEKITKNHNEIFLVTYSTSGTGIGTLLYVLQNLNEKNKETPCFNKDFKISCIVLRHKYDSPHVHRWSENVKLKEWLLLKESASVGDMLFIECNETMNEGLKEQLTEFSIEGFLKSGRLVVLDVLHNQRDRDIDFVTKHQWTYMSGMINFLDKDATLEFTELEIERMMDEYFPVDVNLK